MLRSVPFAVVAWHHCFGDYRATIEAVTPAGGDVDTVTATTGALAGISAGLEGIPEAWRVSLVDWSHSLGYLHRLAAALAGSSAPVNTVFSP